MAARPPQPWQGAGYRQHKSAALDRPFVEDLAAVVLHLGSAIDRTIEPCYRQKALVGAVFGALQAVAPGSQQLHVRLG